MLFYEKSYKRDTPADLGAQLIDIEGESISTIGQLSKINILVGPNNSGKSRILREFVKSRSKKYYGSEFYREINLAVEFLERVVTETQAALPEAKNFTLTNGSAEILSLASIRGTINHFSKPLPDYNVTAFIQAITSIFSADLTYHDRHKYDFQAESKSGTKYQGSFSASQTRNVLVTFRAFIKEKEKIINQLRRLIPPDSGHETTSLYIPAIRSLRNFPAQNSLTIGTKNEYGFKEDTIIYNGERFPADVFEAATSPYEKRIPMEKFKDFLSATFFMGQPLQFTREGKTQQLLIKIGEEEERPIHDLGDGIQMMIILTYPFFAYHGGVIGIEEPELFIHAGLQKDFMRFLISNPVAKEFQVFIATHSNHIIDSIHSGPLVSLFSVSKVLQEPDEHGQRGARFRLENVAHGNENLLNLLGITATSVYLSNCTIWVEGVTDRIYLQHYLDTYLQNIHQTDELFHCKSFKEGIHYSFAFTGGDSIIHWDFDDASEYETNFNKVIVAKFCSKAMVIVDQDFGKNPVRKKALKELLSDRFVELSVPEIENLLPKEAVQETAWEFPTIKKHFSSFEDIPIDAALLVSQKIGAVLDQAIGSSHSPVKTFAASNGSLRSGEKLIFCTQAIKHVRPDNLTGAAKELLRVLLKFISDRNTN